MFYRGDDAVMLDAADSCPGALALFRQGRARLPEPQARATTTKRRRSGGVRSYGVSDFGRLGKALASGARETRATTCAAADGRSVARPCCSPGRKRPGHVPPRLSYRRRGSSRNDEIALPLRSIARLDHGEEPGRARCDPHFGMTDLAQRYHSRTHEPR
jgi:hypothetical protein